MLIVSKYLGRSYLVSARPSQQAESRARSIKQVAPRNTSRDYRKASTARTTRQWIVPNIAASWYVGFHLRMRLRCARTAPTLRHPPSVPRQRLFAVGLARHHPAAASCRTPGTNSRRLLRVNVTWISYLVSPSSFILSARPASCTKFAFCPCACTHLIVSPQSSSGQVQRANCQTQSPIQYRGLCVVQPFLFLSVYYTNFLPTIQVSRVQIGRAFAYTWLVASHLVNTRTCLCSGLLDLKT